MKGFGEYCLNRQGVECWGYFKVKVMSVVNDFGCLFMEIDILCRE